MREGILSAVLGDVLRVKGRTRASETEIRIDDCNTYSYLVIPQLRLVLWLK